jgi:hypothetical protein
LVSPDGGYPVRAARKCHKAAGFESFAFRN